MTVIFQSFVSQGHDPNKAWLMAGEQMRATINEVEVVYRRHVAQGTTQQKPGRWQMTR